MKRPLQTQFVRHELRFQMLNVLEIRLNDGVVGGQFEHRILSYGTRERQGATRQMLQRAARAKGFFIHKEALRDNTGRGPECRFTWMFPKTWRGSSLPNPAASHAWRRRPWPSRV